MKKTLVALGILTSAVIACTPKASKTPAPEPPPSTAVSTADAESIKAGSVLIGSDKCTKCHSDKTDYVPGHTFEEQEKLMQAMAKKAKFTAEETADLMAYVKANAKK